jgi:hypothetical protein
MKISVVSFLSIVTSFGLTKNDALISMVNGIQSDKSTLSELPNQYSLSNISEYSKLNFVDILSSEQLSRLIFNHHTNDSITSTTNLFLGVYEAGCKYLVDNIAVKQILRKVPSSVLTVGIISTSHFPINLSKRSCAEIFFYRMNTSIMNPIARTDSLRLRSLNAWYSEQCYIRFQLKNNFPFPVNIFWINDEELDKLSYTIEAGHDKTIHTYLGNVNEL